MKVAASVISMTSASTISTLSVPMPVDMQLTRMPRYVPVAVVISRLLRSSSIESQRDATFATRPGSPTRRTYSASSPRSRPMWYWRAPVRGASAWVTDGQTEGASLVLVLERAGVYAAPRSRAALARHAHEREARWIDVEVSARLQVPLSSRDATLVRCRRAPPHDDRRGREPEGRREQEARGQGPSLTQPGCRCAVGARCIADPGRSRWPGAARAPAARGAAAAGDDGPQRIARRRRR